MSPQRMVGRLMLVCGLAAPAGAWAQASSAQWHADAAGRIDALRKASLSITVTRPDGTVVPGAQMELKMRRHAFGFGTAVSDIYLIRDPATNANVGRYRDALEKGWYDPQAGRYKPLFNRATIESGMKWSKWEDPARQAAAIEAVDWLLSKGHDIRGHAMIWQHSTRDFGLPDRIYNELFNASGAFSPRYANTDNSPAAQAWRADLREQSLSHIRAIGDHAFAGGVKPVEWDVLNEHRAHNRLAEAINPGVPAMQRPVMKEWFDAAHQATPQARLFVNDYDIVNNGPNNTTVRSTYLQQIQWLQAQGAPIHGIGFQSHFFSGGQRRTGEQIFTVLDQFAATGLRLAITEFDMIGTGWGSNAEQTKATLTSEILIAAFSHPSVDSFTMWGFWDGRHWEGSAPLFDDQWNLKPSGQAYVDLVLKEWWTDLDGTTNAQGVFSGRAMKGDYELMVTVDGVVHTFPISLREDGATQVVVPEPAATGALMGAGLLLRRRRSS